MSAEARPTGAETEREAIAVLEQAVLDHEELAGLVASAPDSNGSREAVVASHRAAAASCRRAAARLRSTETPTEGEAVGYVVVQHAKVWSDRDETQPLVVSGSAPKSLEAALRLAAVERERSACEITVHPVGPALSPVEPEEGDG